jgi:TolB-like protein
LPDIFLSYNREDQAAARRFAEAFEAHGFSVWWDVTLRSGEAYDQVTEKALRDAKAVVVLWSKKSVESRWVRAEATLAERYKTLVPAMIEPCERPIMFELTQTAELSHWQGDRTDKAWTSFLSDVHRFVGTTATPGASTVSTMAAPSLPRPTKISIVVLPFANMSGDPEQEYFSDGISEDIITDLSKVSTLSVISRNSAFTFKGKHVDLPQVARQLQVTHVLEGSVRKSGNRVRITAQLIDGAANDHIWAERYDRDLSDIFALQDEISQAIVTALKVKLFPEDKQAIESRDTTSLEAYDKFLRARALANQGLDSAELFREALAIDPGFARARAELALVYLYRLVFAPLQHEQTIREFADATRETLSHAPGHWASHLATVVLSFLRHDWSATETACAETRARASPSESTAYFFHGLFLGAVGRSAEAARTSELARSADPLSLAITSQGQQDFYISGRIAEAHAEYLRTRDLPGNREPCEHAALFWVWDAGDDERTKAQFRRFLDSQVFPSPVLNAVFEAIDRPADARALIRQAFDDPAYQDSTQMMLLSWYAARFGDTDLANAALRRCYIEMNGLHIKSIWFPFFRDTRATPTFKQFVRDLGLYDYWRASGHWGDFARPVGEDDFEIYR